MAEAHGAVPVRARGPGASRSSTRTAARSPSDPTRPARSAWPAPTRRWRPAGTQCDVVPVTAVLDRFGEPVPDERRRSRSCRRDQLHRRGDPARRREHAEPDAAQGRRAREPRPDRAGAPTCRGPPDRRQDRARRRTTCRWPSSATRRRSPPASWCSTRRRTEDVGGFGGGKGATIWRDAMAPILEARGSGEFPPADPTVVVGNTKPVPGLLVGGPVPQRAEPRPASRSRTARVNSAKPDGDLPGTSPPRGGRAVPGQLVTILISNGSDYVEPTPEPVPVPDPVPTPEPPVEPPESPGEPDLPDMPAGGPRPPGLPDGFPWPPGG